MGSLQPIYCTGTPTQVQSGPCTLAGVIVSDEAAGTYNIHDALGATNVKINIQLAAAGTIAIMFPAPVSFAVGIHLDSASDTYQATFLLA